MKRKKSMEDILNERIGRPFEKRFSAFEKEKNPRKKTELYYNIWSDMLPRYISVISELSEVDYQKLMKERTQEFNKLVGEIKNLAFEYGKSQGTLSFDDAMLLGFQPDNAKDGSESKMDKLLSKNDTAQKLFSLELIRRMQLQLLLAKSKITLQPLLELEQLVKRRFSNDVYWCIAIAILATHENLVKKKLIDLEVSEEEINKIEREKRFSGLVDLLDKKIFEIEKRKVSLTFYKSSSLREQRNTLEHFGYSQPVVKEDVLELLKDITQFEKELFKNS